MPCGLLRPCRVQPFVPHGQPARPAARLSLHAPPRGARVSNPATIPVRDWEGNTIAEERLVLRVAEKATAKGLVHRYLVTVRQNMREGNASTLTRGEVRGGGRKPYRQKGLGRARRGSTRSPLIVGGGVTFGPQPRDWTIQMNKKERRLALATALHSAARDMVVVEPLSSALDGCKTKTLVRHLTAIGADPMKQKVLLIVAEQDETVDLSARNVDKLYINQAGSVHIYDLLNADRVVVERTALRVINDRYGFGSLFDLIADGGNLEDRAGSGNEDGETGGSDEDQEAGSNVEPPKE